MIGIKGIRQTSSTYDIYPIDEKEESLQQFIPYNGQKYRYTDQIDQFSDHNIKAQLSHSFTNTQKRVNYNSLQIRRCKTIGKDPQFMLAKTPSITINGKHTLNYSQPKHAYKVRQERSLQLRVNTRNKLIKLQAQMRRNKPIFSKEIDQGLPHTFKKSPNIPKLDLLSRNNISLTNSPWKQKGNVSISRKELRQLIRIKKLGESNTVPIVKRLINQS